MQLPNASKRTKNAEETSAPVPETNTAAEGRSNPRNSRSSKLKKETSETGSAKHRKSSSPETTVESSPAVDAPVIDSVGVMTPAARNKEVAATSSAISPSHEEIANLAHALWAARGYPQGSAEEDWLRAERELKATR